MAKFLNAHGIEVSAADAKFGGKLRPGFKEIICDGESINTNIMLMDAATMRDAKAKPEPDQTSIDALVKAHIAMLAERQGWTPDEWLAQAGLKDVEDAAVDAVQQFLRAAVAKGVAASLSFDGRTAHAGLTMARDSINRMANAVMRDQIERARQLRYSNPGANMIEPQASLDAMRLARFR